jgi:hypothetical protein
MKERGIPFSAPMAIATLREVDPKTQTRRLLKSEWLRCLDIESDLETVLARCPYGVPGDRLWGREHYRLLPEFDGVPPREAPRGLVRYEADGDIESLGEDLPLEEAGRIIGAGFGKFRPGMFMCRWMSRITLEITGVRVERLQDITEEDAEAEGIRLLRGCDEEGYYLGFHWEHVTEDQVLYDTARDAYRGLWEQINGAGTWDTNPWVWVVDYKLVTP